MKTIKRELKVVMKKNKKCCESSWRLDGHLVSREAIGELTRNMNIDINNLCQILPQERVVEFSKMSPKDLLLSTEKSFGDEQMFKNHQELIELTGKVNLLNKSIKDRNASILRLQTLSVSSSL